MSTRATNNVFDPAATGGLTMTNTWMSNRIAYTDTFNDLRINKSVDSPAFGRHDLTLGVSLSRFTMTQQQLGNTILTDVKNNPDALDIQALDAAGNVVGLVTQNGFTTYGSGDLIGNVHGWATSVYAAENWHITDDWQVDAGVRHESRTEHGERGALGTQTLSTTGPLAARSVTGLIGYVPYSKGYHETSWTVGSLYQLSKSMNAFVRYSDTFSLPRFSDQWANINNGVAGTLPNGQPVPVTPIKQAEAGLKLSVPESATVRDRILEPFRRAQYLHVRRRRQRRAVESVAAHQYHDEGHRIRSRLASGQILRAQRIDHLAGPRHRQRHHLQYDLGREPLG